jgi:hypothetical protein
MSPWGVSHEKKFPYKSVIFESLLFWNMKSTQAFLQCSKFDFGVGIDLVPSFIHNFFPSLLNIFFNFYATKMYIETLRRMRMENKYLNR